MAEIGFIGKDSFKQHDVQICRAVAMQNECEGPFGQCLFSGSWHIQHVPRRHP